MANTVDPDETAHYEPSHLDLQCLQIQLLLCLVLYEISYSDNVMALYHYSSSHSAVNVPNEP